MSPRRILFLTPQLPYPPEQGTALRNYNLLREVSRQHEVSLLSFQEAGAPLPEALSRVCVEVRTVIAPQRSWRERMGTLLSSPLPDMAHRLWCKAFEEALREMEPARFDLVQVEGIELARYGLAVRAWCGPKGPRIVFDDHNAEYVLQRRAFEADRGQPGRWPAALYSLVQWQRLRRFEREVCRAVDGVVAASEADAQALRALVPGLEPLVVPNGVDVERYHPGLADSVPLDHPAVVFTGKMDFRPNVDAVLWFGREVWPRIVRQRPEARFYVVGKSPHRRLQEIARSPGVVITGYVADILPYFGGADVYVVPIRIGGGTRLKILEAMAAGLPLVTTSLGIEGIEAVAGEHALVVDAPKEFADAVLRLLADEEKRRSLGQAARELALQRYDWRRIVPRLEAWYATLS